MSQRVLVSWIPRRAVRACDRTRIFALGQRARPLLAVATVACAVMAAQATIVDASPLRWSPITLPLLAVFAAAITFLHELAHATAVARVSGCTPAIGFAYGPTMGVYAFTDLSRVGSQAYSKLRNVLLAGYDVSMAASVTLWGVAAVTTAPERDSWVVAHALFTAMFCIGLYPSVSGTDLGRLVRLLEQRGATRSTRIITMAWLVGTLACVVWLAFIVLRSEVVW